MVATAEADRGFRGGGIQYLYFRKPHRLTIQTPEGSISPSLDLLGIYLTDKDALNLAEDIIREHQRKHGLERE